MYQFFRECTLAIPLPEELLAPHSSLQDELQKLLPTAVIDRERDVRIKLTDIVGSHTNRGLLGLGQRLEVGGADLVDLTISLTEPLYHRTNYGGILSLVTEDARLKILYDLWRARVPEIARARSRRFRFRPHLGLARIADVDTQEHFFQQQGAINSYLSGLNWRFPARELGIWGKLAANRQAQRVCTITGSSVSLVSGN